MGGVRAVVLDRLAVDELSAGHSDKEIWRGQFLVVGWFLDCRFRSALWCKEREFWMTICLEGLIFDVKWMWGLLEGQLSSRLMICSGRAEMRPTSQDICRSLTDDNHDCHKAWTEPRGDHDRRLNQVEIQITSYPIASRLSLLGGRRKGLVKPLCLCLSRPLWFFHDPSPRLVCLQSSPWFTACMQVLQMHLITSAPCTNDSKHVWLTSGTFRSATSVQCEISYIIEETHRWIYMKGANRLKSQISVLVEEGVQESMMCLPFPSAGTPRKRVFNEDKMTASKFNSVKYR